MSEWKCEKCGKYKPVDHNSIKEGDKVTFSVATVSGSSVRYSCKYGVVIACGLLTFTVKQKRSKSAPLKIKRESVFPSDAPSSLSYQLFGTCDCGGSL